MSTKEIYSILDHIKTLEANLIMIRILAFILCRIFFKRICISGTPYSGGSAIWASNHSSGIVDPTVMLGLAPVAIRPFSKTHPLGYSCHASVSKNNACHSSHSATRHIKRHSSPKGNARTRKF